MSLLTEYRLQKNWRKWDQILELCPIKTGQKIVDLGCGSGDVCHLLAQKDLSVTGVDGDINLIEGAKSRYPDIHFVHSDLRSFYQEEQYNGLWCSFTAAYFPDFKYIFERWTHFLSDHSWVCVVEMEDLLGHHPLPSRFQSKIKRFYDLALKDGKYDFFMGKKIETIIQSAGFITNVISLEDPELSMDGPADDIIIDAWRKRFLRMPRLKEFFENDYEVFTDTFIKCLQHSDHKSDCKVTAVIGIK